MIILKATPCSSRPRNAGDRIQQASMQTNITASTFLLSLSLSSFAARLGGGGVSFVGKS